MVKSHKTFLNNLFTSIMINDLACKFYRKRIKRLQWKNEKETDCRSWSMNSSSIDFYWKLFNLKFDNWKIPHTIKCWDFNYSSASIQSMHQDKKDINGQEINVFMNDVNHIILVMIPWLRHFYCRKWNEVPPLGMLIMIWHKKFLFS